MVAVAETRKGTYRTVRLTAEYAREALAAGRLDFYLVSAERFYGAVQSALKTSNRARQYLSAYELDEYREMRCYLSADGLSMFAIAHGDELVSVCNAGARGRGHQMMLAAIEAGAARLDCFDGYLPPFYTRYGFVEEKREANWTPGGPDVVYMRLP
jgi:hypothetical protein